MDAGVEILLHPEMAHAKVLRIDDQVLIGGCNLDDLSLFRNDELDLLFADPAVAELTERTIFDELAAMSTPATRQRPARRQRAWNAAMDRVSRFLCSRVPSRTEDGCGPRTILVGQHEEESRMSIGPVEYIAIAFPGNKFSGRDHPGHQGAPGERHDPRSSTW